MNAMTLLSTRRRAIRPALCLLLTLSLLGLASFSSRTRPTAKAAPPVAPERAPETTHTSFNNPSAITPADRASNNAGTNPGLPALYPSNITASGLTGVVSKVSVALMISSTFPDDIDMLLVGPTGAHSLVISDAGGSGDHVGVGFFFDPTAPTAWPDNSANPISTGAYLPVNYASAQTAEPGGVDNFPAPGPGLINYTADFSVFNGTNPNGVWKLYIVDDQVTDTSQFQGGWSIDITTVPGGCTGADRPVDMNGDGKTDYQVTRTISGVSNWFTLANGTFTATQFGLPTDRFLPADYDGDNKADVAVWRGGNPGVFYIIQSSTGTLRTEVFGLPGDNPTVIGDYDGDGRVDPAVYRPGTASSQAIWFFKSSVNGLTQSVFWGNQGDLPVPGDFDGDGKYDRAVNRNVGGQATFYRLLSNGGADGVAFGIPGDYVVPGYYDGDCKQDIAVMRVSGPNLIWFILNSTNGQVRGYGFGTSATDYSAQGDYDGDGITDVAVYRPNANAGQGFFFLLKSTDGTFLAQNWGVTGDFPTAYYNTH